MESSSTIIAQLNDRFRHGDRSLGTYTMTPGVQALAPEKILQLAKSVQSFDSFAEDNDPYQEHDFGAIVMDNDKYFWKIDYYNPTFSYSSEDPSNTEVTKRVLTVMKSSEY